MKTFKTFMLSLSVVGALHSLPYPAAIASDHDDGEISLKGRSLNLTDLYVFREDWQDPTADQENLILIMNTNPRSVARQQYFFSTEAIYTFHLSRVLNANKTKRPTGLENLKISFSFGPPNATGNQPITLKMPGYNGSAGLTTSLADMNVSKLNLNPVTVRSKQVSVFAGLREDSFFFDVERYFRIRALLATGVNTLQGPLENPTQGGGNPFRSNSTAVDFTTGYNVNSIVVKIPLSLLRENVNQEVFDVWESISTPTLVTPTANSYVKLIIDIYAGVFDALGIGSRQQVERLGRPAINEGLVFSNDKLNAFNRIRPNQDLSAAAGAVMTEAALVLEKVNEFGVSLGLPAPAVKDVAAGFLPDVMRIDTRKKVATAASAYNSDFVIVEGTTGGAMLTGGRKIEDDVMDITLSYLIAGDPSGASIKDGVSYSGNTDCLRAGQGTNIANPGHRCLRGQTERLGAAKFPFLAEPN